MKTLITDKFLDSFFKDRNTRFPNYPRLVKEVGCYEAPYGLGIQFRGGPKKVILKGKNTSTLFKKLAPYLDGCHHIDDIFETMKSNFSVKNIAILLKTLYINGLLVNKTEEKNEIVTPSLEYYNRIITKTGFKKNGAEVIKTITKTRALFIITEDLLMPMLLYVKSAGLQNIGLLSLDLSKNELKKKFDFNSFPSITYLESYSKLNSQEIVDNIYTIADNYQFIVVGLNNPSRDFLLSINRIALTKDKGLYFINRIVNTFEIGPYIIPKRSSCYSCYILRKNSFEKDALFENVYQDSLNKKIQDRSISGWDEISSFTAFGWLMGDLIKSITGIEIPKLLNKVVEYNSLEGTFVENHIIKVPACPQCGGTQLGNI